VSNGKYVISYPKNERILNYLPESPEKDILKKAINKLKSTKLEIPLIFNGNAVRTGDMSYSIMLYNHHHILDRYNNEGEEEVVCAIKSALDSKKTWTIIS